MKATHFQPVPDGHPLAYVPPSQPTAPPKAQAPAVKPLSPFAAMLAAARRTT